MSVIKSDKVMIHLSPMTMTMTYLVTFCQKFHTKQC